VEWLRSGRVGEGNGLVLGWTGQVERGSFWERGREIMGASCHERLVESNERTNAHGGVTLASAPRPSEIFSTLCAQMCAFPSL